MKWFKRKKKEEKQKKDSWLSETKKTISGIYHFMVHDCWIVNAILIVFFTMDIIDFYDDTTTMNKVSVATFPLRILLTYGLFYLLFYSKNEER